MYRLTVSAILLICLLVLAAPQYAGAQTPITYGTTVHDAIAVAAEVDSFSFSGVAGETVTIRFTGTWTTAPRLQLSSPGGTLLRNLTGAAIRIDTLPLTATGSYAIKIFDDNAVDTGSYSLHVQRLVEPVGASALTYGETLEDTITQRGDVRAWTFPATAGEVVTVFLASSWSNLPRLELYDASGRLRRRVDAQSARIDTFHIAESGTHTLLVLDNDGLQAGNYAIHCQRVVNPVGAGVISFGQTLQDSISRRGQIRARTFSGFAGEVVTVLLAGSWNNAPRLELYDPAGTLKKRLDGQSVRADTVHLPATGTYTLFVLDNDGQQTGNFGLHLQRIGDPVGATALQYGHTFQDSISARAQIRTFTLAGNAGDVITALLAGSWTTTPRIEVYDPAGVLRKRIESQTARVDTFHLPSTGLYTFCVLDNDGQQTGNFGLHLQRIVTPLSAGTLLFGQTIQDSIRERAAIEACTFQGTAGSVITVFLAGSWNNTPRLEIYDPSGALKKRIDGQAARADTMHLGETGTYTVLILDNDGQQAGGYGLHLQRIVSPDGAYPLIRGETVQDTIAARGSIRPYTFNGSAGEVVTLLSAGSWSNMPRLELYDPAGALRRRVDAQTVRIDTFRLDQTGAYTLFMLDNDGQQSGGFSIAIQSVTAPGGASPLSYGMTVQDTVRQRGEIRTFTFNGTEGDVILALFASTLTSTGRLELYDPAGRLRKRADGATLRFDTLRLASSGVHTLLVLDNDGQQTGNFGIHLQRLADPPGARSLQFGETVQDTLSLRSQVRAFTFAGAAGDMVTLRLAGSGMTYYLSLLDVYAPAGALLKRTTASNDLRVDTLRLPSEGTYAVCVSDNDGQQTGTFGLHLQRLSAPGGATTLTFGETVQDTIVVRAGISAYSFWGTAGEMTTLKLAGTGVAGFLPVVEVYTPSGSLTRRTTASNDLRIDTLRLTGTGLQTVLVLDNDGQQSGNFGLHLQRIITPGNARPITYGQTIADTIYERAEINAYAFTGTAGEVATLRSYASGLGFSMLELYHADGRLWKRLSASNVLRMDTLHLPASGNYTILMLDDNGQETGIYGMHLQRLVNPAGAGAIAYGDTLQGVVSQRTEAAAYTFAGAQSDTISLRMDAAWSNGPQLELYRSDGTLLRRVSGVSTARIDTFKLPATGMYAVLALDNDGAQTGGYTLSLTGRVSTISTVTTIVSHGWNILSVPVIVNDSSRSGIYPGSIAGAYRYTPGVGYSLHDTLSNAVGYWVKFGSAQVVPVTGATIRTDTLEVQQGWNMIGTISFPVPVSSIASIPPGIITGSFFGYNGSYTVVDTLGPGQGFWVKMNAPGQVLLGQSVSARKSNKASRPLHR